MSNARHLRWPFRRPALGRRGAVAVMFGVAIVPMLVGTIAVIDVSRMMAGKSALQRIADNAALTGASVYTAYTASDSFKTIAEAMATSSFCNAANNLPAGFNLKAPASGTVRDCGTGVGPTAVGQITGYTIGTRGLTAGSGCTATHTVVPVPVKCAFAVTVTARATMTSISASLLGTADVTITATAVNPFIDLSKALDVKFISNAENANSIWVYPVLLNDDGNPDFVANSGALPDTSACTGNPMQFNCGVYTMIASNHFGGCTDVAPCTYGTTIVGGGKIVNPIVSTAVITATTPLGFAMASVAAGNNSAPDGWYSQEDSGIRARIIPPSMVGKTYNDASGNTVQKVVNSATGCVYPFSAVYDTYVQMYKADSSGIQVPLMPWTRPTHWFYSSFLQNNRSPMQVEIDFQTAPGTYMIGSNTHNNNQQRITPTEDNGAAAARILEGVSKTCPPTSIVGGYAVYPDSYYIYKPTSFENPRNNCALYIGKDAASTYPDPSYLDTRPNQRGTPPYYKTCFSPVATDANATPGNAYSIIQCQQFKGHTFTYYWNDASGKADDTDYGNGNVTVNCKAQTQVVLVD